MAWLSVLAKASIPVLVCLTHADKLVAELMPEPGVLPNSAESQKCIEETRQVCVCVSWQALSVDVCIGELG